MVTDTPWKPHPVLAAIPNDDPDVIVALAGITAHVVPMEQIVKGGLHGRTTTYAHARPYTAAGTKHSGLLKTFSSMGRRGAFALDVAKYDVALKRLGEQDEPIAGRRRADRIADATNASLRARGYDVEPAPLSARTPSE